MRCGAIYTTLSAYFLANGTKKEEKDSALLLDRYSEKLVSKSIEISISKINMSQESIIKRMESLVKINSLENHADNVFDMSIKTLFDNENDFKNLIRRREVYTVMEVATDKCEDVANVIETIIVKYA